MLCFAAFGVDIVLIVLPHIIIMPKRYCPASFTLNFKKAANRDNFTKHKDRAITVTKFPFLPILNNYGWYQGVLKLLRRLVR